MSSKNKKPDAEEKLGDSVVYIKDAKGALRPVSLTDMTEEQRNEIIQNAVDVTKKPGRSVAPALDVLQSARTAKGDVVDGSAIEPSAPASQVSANTVVNELPEGTLDGLVKATSFPQEDVVARGADATAVAAGLDQQNADAASARDSRNLALVNGLEDAGNAVAQGVRGAVDMLPSAATVAKTVIDPLGIGRAIVAPEVINDKKGKDVPAQVAPQVQGQPPGGSASVDVKLSGKSPNTGVGGPKAAKDYTPELVAAVERSALGEEQVLLAKMRAQELLAAGYQKMEAQQLNYAADVKAREQVMQDRFAKFEKMQTALNAKIAQQDVTVDPNRYWNNKTGGQKALGAIAGALFGFAGKGIDYMKVINSEVDQDIEAQRATFAERGSQNTKIQSGIDSLYAEARKSGMSDVEAAKTAEIAIISSIENYIKYQGTQGAMLEGNASIYNMLVGLQERKVRAGMEGQKAAGEAAERAGAAFATVAAARTAQFNADTQRMGVENDRIKIGMKEGADKKKPAPFALLNKVAGYKELLGVYKKAKELSDAGTVRKATRATSDLNPLSYTPGVTEVEFPLGVGSFASADAENDMGVQLNEAILRALTKAQVGSNDDRRLGASGKLPINKMGSSTSKRLEAYIEMTEKELKELVDSAKDYDMSGVAMPADEEDPNFRKGEE